MRRSAHSNAEFHLSTGEIRKLIYNGPKSYRDRCILKTFAHSGIRRAELATLDLSDVDLQNQRLRVQGKGGKERLVPMTPELASDLEHLIGRRRSGPLFVSARGRRISIRTLNWIVTTAGQRAGIVNPNPRSGGRCNPHLLRHSLSRTWKKAGGSIEVLSKILGHTSCATTMDLYGAPSAQDVHDDYDALMAGLY